MTVDMFMSSYVLTTYSAADVICVEIQGAVNHIPEVFKGQ